MQASQQPMPGSTAREAPVSYICAASHRGGAPRATCCRAGPCSLHQPARSAALVHHQWPRSYPLHSGIGADSGPARLTLVSFRWLLIVSPPAPATADLTTPNAAIMQKYTNSTLALSKERTARVQQ